MLYLLAQQSQKRKRGGMRGALPPKSIPCQAPSSSGRVNDIIAKLKNPLKRPSLSVPTKTDEAHIMPKPEPMEEDYAGEKMMQDRVSNGSIVKREWEEVDAHQVGVSNMEFRPPKRMKRGGVESGYHLGMQLRIQFIIGWGLLFCNFVSHICICSLCVSFPSNIEQLGS